MAGFGTQFGNLDFGLEIELDVYESVTVIHTSKTIIRINFQSNMRINDALKEPTTYTLQAITSGAVSSLVSSVILPTGIPAPNYADLVISGLTGGSEYRLTFTSAALQRESGEFIYNPNNIANFNALTFKPYIVEAYAASANSVDITFNEAFTINANLINPANYVFTNGLVAKAISVISETQVRVFVSPDMAMDQLYVVTVGETVTISDLFKNPLDLTKNTAQFLGFRAAITEAFNYDIYKFIIKAIRDEDKLRGDLFLYRLLLGPQADFERTYRDIKAIRDFYDYQKCPAGYLKYLKNLVGFTDEGKVEPLINSLNENELRRLIKIAIPVWKLKGTESAYDYVLDFFGVKNLRIDGYHYYKWLLGKNLTEEDVIGEDLDGKLGEDLEGTDSWLISSGTDEDPDEYTTDIVIMDKSTAPINKQLIKNYFALLRPVSERINLIYVEFLDQFNNTDYYSVEAGTATLSSGTLVHSAENTLTLAVEANSANWTDVHILWKLKINTQVPNDPDNKVRLVFYYLDEDNYMFIELDMGAGTGVGTVKLGKRVDASDTIFGTAINVPMDFDTYYCWRISVISFEDPNNSFEVTQQHKVFQDRNEIILYNEDTDSSSLTKGNFGVKSYKAYATIDEVELYQYPLTVDWVYPELKISPRTSTVQVSQSINFVGYGGVKPYMFSFVTNNSNGSINTETGAYIAGTIGEVIDTIKITDQHGEEVIAYITVTP